MEEFRYFSYNERQHIITCISMTSSTTNCVISHMSNFSLCSCTLSHFHSLTHSLTHILHLFLSHQLMQLEELNPQGCTFLGMGGSADLDLLEERLRAYSIAHSECGESVEREGRDKGPTGGVAAVFTEFPSNPLLKCPDLHR